MMRLIITLLLVLLSARVNGQKRDYIFKQLSVESGLSHPRVQSVLTDSQGIMWIGTEAGLNRFDGYTLKKYFHDSALENSLPENYIRFVMEDSKGVIWVSTAAGTVRYDKENDCFIRVMFDERALNTFSYFDNGKSIFFCSAGEIIEYSYDSETFKNICTIPNIYGIEQYDHKNLLLSSRSSGLWMLNLKSCTASRIDNLGGNGIWALCRRSDNTFWLSIYNHGVCRLNNKLEVTDWFTTENSNLSNNNVLDIREHEGKIWLATDGGGIALFDDDKRSFTIIENIPGDRNSIPASSFYCLYTDPYKNIWAGSIREGLILIKPTDIQTYKYTSLGGEWGLSHKVVISILPEANGTLWIGTDGGGVNSFDPVTTKFRHYPSTYGDKIAAICEYSPTELLISSFNKGLFIFDKICGRLTPFVTGNKTEENSEFSTGNLVNLFSTPQDIYIFGRNLKKYNRKKRTLTNVVSTMVDMEEQQGMQPFAYRDSVLYLMSYHSIIKYDERSDSLHSELRVGVDTVFMAACLDNDGKIWIGGNTGLSIWEGEKGKMSTVESKLFHTVSTLTLDSKERLWFGGDNMLFCYIPYEHRIINFGESVGVSPGKFIFTLPLNVSNFDSYFASTAGLIRINRKIDIYKTDTPQVSLSDVAVDGKTVMNIYTNEDNKTLNLPFSHTSLSISVIAREEDIFRKRLFRYYIKGLENYPQESYDHTLSLGNLSPGTYRISVSCSMANGDWTEPEDIIEIVVSPPLWRKGWFITSFIALILLGATLVANRIVRHKRQKMNIQLRDMERSNYRDKVDYLINISHELRTPLTLILAPLKELMSDKSIKNGQAEQIKNIYNNSCYMRNVINMTLDISKMENGKSALSLSENNLRSWIENIVLNFTLEARNRGIEITIDTSTSVERHTFDESKCRIVLSNLIMNALKFSPNNSGIIIKSELTSHLRVRISVIDSGIGVSTEDIPYLFEPFYQGKHNFGGSGIGLSYSKQLIEQQGGTMGVENNSNSGATFYYELPLQIHSIASAVSRREEPEKNGENTIDRSLLKQYAVLVVDDDNAMLDFLANILSGWMKNVRRATNGRQALEILNANNDIDIIVSDVVMPQMSGFELCKEVKSNIEISHIPIVLLTNQVDISQQKTGYKLGADGYIGKPFEIDYLMMVIYNVLKNRKLIVDNSKSIVQEPEQITFSSADEQFLRKLNEVIVNNIPNADYSIGELSADMAMSRSSLYNKVSKLTGYGVSNYINRKRIEKAIKLLETTEKSITEISEEVGFKYQRYFSTVFREQTGVSPTDWRRMKG